MVWSYLTLSVQFVSQVFGIWGKCKIEKQMCSMYIQFSKIFLSTSHKSFRMQEQINTRVLKINNILIVISFFHWVFLLNTKYSENQVLSFLCLFLCCTCQIRNVINHHFSSHMSRLVWDLLACRGMWVSRDRALMLCRLKQIQKTRTGTKSGFYFVEALFPASWAWRVEWVVSLFNQVQEW